jgi:hypothetical protein
MKTNKWQVQVDTLFVKDETFAHKSLRIANNQKVQMVLSHQRTSLNYDKEEVEGIA